MWKRMVAGIFTMVVVMFSGHDLGSITGGPIESRLAIFHYKYKPDGLDSLVFSFDDFIRQSVDIQKQSPGAAAVVVYKGEIVLLKGYGVKKLGIPDSVDIHTAFRMGSVSKGFASVLTGILVNEGLLSWDDPVKTYLPDFRLKDTAAASHLTIRHILSHTSGFPAHTYTEMLDHGYSYESIKCNLADVPLVSKPGALFAYQNVVYSLIGDILQKASGGKSYNDLLREKIFGPLGMHEASTDFASFNDNPNSCYPHLRTSKGFHAKAKNDRYYTVSPASGVNASAADMAQWLLGLTGYYPEVIPGRTIRDISNENIETPRKYAYRVNWKTLDKTFYGLGWRIFDFDHHNLIYHGGYVEGFRTEIAFDPTESIGVIVMFNSNTSLASHCLPGFFDKFYHLSPAEDNGKYMVDN